MDSVSISYPPMIIAQQEGRPFQYLQEKIKKEELAKQIAERDHIEEGLICISSVLEPCRTLSFRTEKGKPFVASARRKCLFLRSRTLHTSKTSLIHAGVLQSSLIESRSRRLSLFDHRVQVRDIGSAQAGNVVKPWDGTEQAVTAAYNVVIAGIWSRRLLVKPVELRQSEA